MIAPGLGLLVVNIARYGTYRSYRKFVEGETILAKIESRLGLDKDGCLGDGSGNQFWGSEPLIAPRSQEYRTDYRQKTSEDFVSKHEHLGYQKATERLLLVMTLLRSVMLVALVWLACYLGCAPPAQSGTEPVPTDGPELSLLSVDARTRYVADFNGADGNKRACYMLRWESISLWRTRPAECADQRVD